MSPSKFNFHRVGHHSWDLDTDSCGVCGLTAEMVIKSTSLESVRECNPPPVLQPPRIPDYHQALTGWRGWSMELGGDSYPKHLMSLGIGGSHYPKQMAWVAQCGRPMDRYHPRIEVPSYTCTCGFYAAKKIADIFTLCMGVLGKVELWGKVVEHVNGYRAEKMYPLFFIVSNFSIKGLSSTSDVPDRVHFLSQWGVPVYTLEDPCQLSKMLSL